MILILFMLKHIAGEIINMFILTALHQKWEGTVCLSNDTKISPTKSQQIWKLPSGAT